MIYEQLKHLGPNFWRIDAMIVEFWFNDLLLRDTVFVQKQINPRERYIVIANRQPSLDQTLYAIAEFEHAQQPIEETLSPEIQDEDGWIQQQEEER